jgi:hypothetical protein
MNQQSNPHEQTSRPDMQHEHKPSHHATNLAQITYQNPFKIKNCSTHLGITIRWVEEPEQNRHRQLILESASDDLVGVVG